MSAFSERLNEHLRDVISTMNLRPLWKAMSKEEQKKFFEVSAEEGKCPECGREYK
jgi:HrpA-like RNA helicase